MTSDGLALEFSGLTKRFGAVTAVNALTTRVEPGTVTGFLGPNGAGKTTSMRMLLGLVRPTSGAATIGGRAYRDLEHPLRTVGAVLESDSFHPGRTAANHLRVVSDAAGIDRSRAAEVLELVGLTDAAGRKVGGFSLGMRQRLSLATALLGDPGVLVLDEPVNGLDPEGIKWMRTLLRGFADEGRTVLVSSHLLSEVQQTADALLMIAHGSLVFQGDFDDLVSETEETTVVDAPDRAALSSALRTAGLSFDVLRSGLTVRGASAADVGAAAAAGGVALSALQRRGAGLEEIFFDLVNGVRVHPSANRAAAELPAVTLASTVPATPPAATFTDLITVQPEVDQAPLVDTAAVEVADTSSGAAVTPVGAAGVAAAAAASAGVAAGDAEPAIFKPRAPLRTPGGTVPADDDTATAADTPHADVADGPMWAEVTASEPPTAVIPVDEALQAVRLEDVPADGYAQHAGPGQHDDPTQDDSARQGSARQGSARQDEAPQDGSVAHDGSAPGDAAGHDQPAPVDAHDAGQEQDESAQHDDATVAQDEAGHAEASAPIVASVALTAEELSRVLGSDAPADAPEAPAGLPEQADTPTAVLDVSCSSEDTSSDEDGVDMSQAEDAPSGAQGVAVDAAADVEAPLVESPQFEAPDIDVPFGDAPQDGSEQEAPLVESPQFEAPDIDVPDDVPTHRAPREKHDADEHTHAPDATHAPESDAAHERPHDDDVIDEADLTDAADAGPPPAEHTSTPADVFRSADEDADLDEDDVASAGGFWVPASASAATTSGRPAPADAVRPPRDAEASAQHGPAHDGEPARADAAHDAAEDRSGAHPADQYAAYPDFVWPAEAGQVAHEADPDDATPARADDPADADESAPGPRRASPGEDVEVFESWFSVASTGVIDVVTPDTTQPQDAHDGPDSDVEPERPDAGGRRPGLWGDRAGRGDRHDSEGGAGR